MNLDNKFIMKIKYILILLVIAFLTTTVGALFKFLHWSYGNEVLLFGVLIKIIIGIVLIFKLFTTKKFKEFLNW